MQQIYVAEGFFLNYSTCLLTPMSAISLCAKDVASLLNVSLDTGKRHLQRVRAHLGKPARGVVTIAEFCHYYQLDEAEVRAALDRG